MVITRSEADVLGMPFAEFLDYMDEHWAQGQHVALVGPTGTGKSTMAVHLLSRRHYVAAFDPKGGDDTLAKLRRHGFVRIDSWPPSRKIRADIEKGKPARLIVGPVVRSRADLPRLRKTFAAALDDIFDEGGWTLYLDELQIAADRRLMNLGGSIERLLISARSKGVSVISAYQRPANVPRSAADQSTFFISWFTRDVDVVARLGEMAGRPRAEMRGLMRGIGEMDHAVAVFDRNPRHPVIITKAPKA